MSIISRTMYPIQNGVDQIQRMQKQFSKLQVQLATGQKAGSLAEMGSDRYFDLSLRARIGRTEGYQNNIKAVDLRLDVLDKAVTRLDALEGEARTAITPGAYGTGNINFGTVPALARSRLDEALTVMNTDVDGRYVFGGNTIDRKPVGSVAELIDGAAGKAGFTQVAAERKAADLGAAGLGRLTVGNVTDTVSLAEDGAHPFGFKLSTLTSSSAAVSLTQPNGSPPALAVKFNALPVAGESVTIGLTLPDGTEEGVSLKAVTGTPGAGEFQIGIDADTTAANFAAALTTSLGSLGSTKLAVASNFAAAENFFNRQGQPALRVDGPPFDSATALVTADPATTVDWYRGSDSATARTTVGTRIDDNTSINYGVQANESGPLALVRSLAVAAIQTFPAADPTSNARFDALANRNLSRLAESHNSESGSIEMIAVELGTAQASAANASDRHTAHKAQLTGLLSDIETVPTEDIAMQILALQTRMQTSYQATAIIGQMSLANYLR